MTKKELQDQLIKVAREACAYQEAFWALQRGDKPITIASGDYTVQLLAPGRACGGVVVEGPLVRYARDWMDSACDVDPYRDEIGRRIVAFQSAALDNGTTSPPRLRAGNAPALRLVRGQP